MSVELQAPPLTRRMACWLYEGILLCAVLFIADYLFSTLSQTRDATNNRNARQAFLFVILGIYCVWFWSMGQTLAMKTWHIRMVDSFGNPVTQGRALMRYLFCWVWFLPTLAVLAPFQPGATAALASVIGWIVMWAALSRLQPQQQFWHDALAGTRLISTRA